MAEMDRSPYDLAGKRILVTGAAGGIGGATIRLCLLQGAQVVGVDIIDAANIRKSLGSCADSVEVHSLDVTVRADVESLIAGIGPIFGLVDTAAICPDGEWTDDGWDAILDRTLNVNIKGPINLTRALLPGMAERGEGRMVLCGSVAGWMGGIRSGPHYAFTKGGMHAFIRWLSQRAAPQNVLVNGLAPGAVDTGMIRGKGYDPTNYPMRRLATPEEIAAAAVFFLGPGASYASGAILDINGGVFFH